MENDIKEKLPSIRENVRLAPYTTFDIGGEAKYFLEVEEKEQLIEAIKLSKENNIPFFILGKGSNLLISDEGFNGLVIKVNFRKINFEGERVVCGAGVLLNKLVKRLTEESLSGLEWAIGIPGTVGGAIRGNAGAFGGSMIDNILEVEVLKLNSEIEIRKYNKEELKVDYRDSIFKKEKNAVIISASFNFKKGNKEEIKKKVNEYLNYRKEKHPVSFLSAGSIFKNPQGKSAGELIEKCGLKGKKIGGAKISEKHSNFIINIGNAEAKDVLDLISLAKKEVKDNFGIELEEEIELVGF